MIDEPLNGLAAEQAVNVQNIVCVASRVHCVCVLFGFVIYQIKKIYYVALVYKKIRARHALPLIHYDLLMIPN